MLKANLQALYSSAGGERCGIVLNCETIMELENIHPDPTENFAFETSYLDLPGVTGTWHTHPNTGPNLTLADRKAFLAFPKLNHYIISASEVWQFRVQNGILCNYENSPPRLFKGAALSSD